MPAPSSPHPPALSAGYGGPQPDMQYQSASHGHYALPPPHPLAQKTSKQQLHQPEPAAQHQHYQPYSPPQQHTPPPAAHMPGAGKISSYTAAIPPATPIPLLARSPARIDCPACGMRDLTIISFHTGNSTHGWALGVCLVTGCGCIPYFITGLKDIDHKCGHCGVTLATWHRSGWTEVVPHV